SRRTRSTFLRRILMNASLSLLSILASVSLHIALPSAVASTTASPSENSVERPYYFKLATCQSKSQSEKNEKGKEKIHIFSGLRKFASKGLVVNELVGERGSMMTAYELNIVTKSNSLEYSGHVDKAKVKFSVPSSSNKANVEIQWHVEKDMREDEIL